MKDNNLQNEIRIEDKGNVIVISIIGAVETMKSLELEEAIKPYIEKSEPKIIFDMSEVTHLSSSGIRVLLATLREVNSRNGVLVLCCLSEVVRKMVDAIELNQLFKIYPDVNSALKNFK